MTRIRAWWAVAMALWLVGCISAPNVIIVDRTTALEQQASGRFPDLERELVQAGVSPQPRPYTRGQLNAVGWTTPRERDAIARLAEARLRDRARLDGLLLRRCIGEANSGELQSTREACQGAVDPAAVSQLIGRANRDRRQLWLYLQRVSRKPASVVRAAWRKTHALAIPCGGWEQQPDGSWRPKSC